MDTGAFLIGGLGGLAVGALAVYAWLKSSGAAEGARSAALREQLDRSLAETKSERDRVDETARGLARSEQERRALQERIAERERMLKDWMASFDEARSKLVETFKATGSDVLKSTATELLKQAKTQFDGQHQLSQADLEARQKAIDATLLPLKEQLTANAQLVKDLTEKREGDSKALGEQLKQIADLQQRASAAAMTLSSAMRDTRQRGQWGEVSLRNVLEMAGMEQHISFALQQGITSDEGDMSRPDCIIKLPGRRFIPLDSKVPMNSYFDALDTTKSDAERAAARTAHAQAVKTHVRALVKRQYVKALTNDFGTAEDMTIMFIPVESALTAAFETDAEIFTSSLRDKIIITTPSTLLALLRTCALQWMQEQLNENARRIGDQAKQLLERLTVFTDHLEKMKKGLDGANKSYDDAVRSFNARLLPAARKTAELMGDAKNEPAELPTVAAILPEDVASR